MSARQVALAGGRVGIEIPADEAGEFLTYVESEPAVLWRDAGHITARQAEALMQLARLYTFGGGMSVWRRGYGGPSEQDEDAVANARREWAALCLRAPYATRWTLLPACLGTLSRGRGIPALRDALEAVADALRVERV